MNKILTTIIALFMSMAMSAETIDFGALELDKEYVLGDFKTYKGSFTATKSGVITCYCTSTDDMRPYSDAKGNKAVSITMNGLYGEHTYDFKVEEGVTYYMFSNFIMTKGTFTMTFSDNVELTLTGTSSANGVYNVSAGGQISINFNKAVNCTGASISVNGKSQKLSPQTSGTSVFFNDVKGKVWEWLNNGTAKSGDKFTISLTGVSLKYDKTVLYQGTGNVSVDFTIGDMPITLVSTENTSGQFLSYYATNNEKGIVKLHFSGKVSMDKLSAQMKFGSIDDDPDGGYYVEYFTPTLEDDGTTICVNLQGKRRKFTDMITKTDGDYTIVAIGVTGVMDEKGNYAYSAAEGSLGSYWFSYEFKEITANVTAEFTPASGSELDKYKEIEIWVTDDDKLSYDGINFQYEKDGETKNVQVLNAQLTKEKDPDNSDAVIITFDVPTELKGATNINLSFINLQCADGSDYSSVLRAKYNALIISTSKPAANATIKEFTAGEKYLVKTNKDSQITSLNILLRDLNPAEGDDEILFEIVSTNKTVRGFLVVLDRNYRLELGHDYRLEASCELGSDYIIIHGSGEVFKYSATVLESVTPNAGAALSTNEDNTVTLQYDGMVMLSAEENYVVLSDGTKAELDGIVAVSPNEEGYANTWKLTVKGETVAKSAETLSLHIVAIDMDENRVQGNTDKKDYSYETITFATDNTPSGIADINASTVRNANAYNLAGQRVNVATAKGIVIVNGRKSVR